MPCNPKHSLVLFDWDGYTAILNSSRIQRTGRLGGPLFVSCRGTLSYDGRLHKVEVLQLSDSKEELEEFDSDWAQTHRAKAISEERDRRQNSRGRAKTGGYLDIWNDPDSDNQEEAHEDLPDPNDQVATVPPVTDKRPDTREIKGSKDRKVTVLYEGSSSTSPPLSPQRPPCYFNELEADDAEVIRLHMRTHKEGKMCSSSQTEKVVIIEDEVEILDLIASRKKTMVDSATQTENTAQDTDQRTTDSCSQTDENHSKNSSDNKSIQTDPADLSVVTSKLDEILSLLKRKKEPLNVSDVLRWVTSTTSTPVPGMQSVTIVPVEEDSILGAREPTSPVFNSEVVTREMDEEYSPPPVKKTLFVKEQEDVPEDGDVDTENVETGERIPFSDVTHKVVNKKTTGSKDKVLTLECRPTATTIEIKDRSDVVFGDFEFRVRRDILSDLKDASCSDGNFMWLLARRIFHDDELVGRNFFGRKGRLAISPRRRNCLKAAFLEYCGSNYADFTKAVNSINNGIRSLRR